MEKNKTVTPQNYYNGSYITTTFKQKNALIAAQAPREKGIP
jgi:protein tyrosine phosphatase